MVILLTLPEGSGSIDRFIQKSHRAYGRRVGETTYDEIARRRVARSAVYCFGDRIRMSPAQRRIAGRIFDQLSSAGLPCLNDPRKQLGRFELLRTLYDQGLNDFNVYRLDEELDEARYPVFLRCGDDHRGPYTGLLYDRDQVEAAKKRLTLAGTWPERLIAVEFMETRSEDGPYRKYGVLRFGRSIVGQHVLHAQDWQVKVGISDTDEYARSETNAFFTDNPHAELVAPLFDVAGIEYGRIDYALVNGRVQTWEINDCPMLGTSHAIASVTRHVKFMAALDTLGERDPRIGEVPLDVFGSDMWEDVV